MKQASPIWRTAAILAICLCLVVSVLWIAGVSTKNKAPVEARASSETLVSTNQGDETV